MPETVEKLKRKLKKLLTKQKQYGNINELLLRTKQRKRTLKTED